MKKKKKEIRRTWKYIQISSYLLLRVEFKNEKQHGSRLLQNNCSAHIRTDDKKEAKASATLHSRFCRGRGSSLLAKFTANQSYQLVVVHVYVYTHTYFSSKQETRSAKSRTPIFLIKFPNFERCSFLTYFCKDTSLINYIPKRSSFSLKPISYFRRIVKRYILEKFSRIGSKFFE